VSQFTQHKNGYDYFQAGGIIQTEKEEEYDEATFVAEHQSVVDFDLRRGVPGVDFMENLGPGREARRGHYSIDSKKPSDGGKGGGRGGGEKRRPIELS